MRSPRDISVCWDESGGNGVRCIWPASQPMNEFMYFAHLCLYAGACLQTCTSLHSYLHIFTPPPTARASTSVLMAGSAFRQLAPRSTAGNTPVEAIRQRWPDCLHPGRVNSNSQNYCPCMHAHNTAHQQHRQRQCRSRAVTAHTIRHNYCVPGRSSTCVAASRDGGVAFVGTSAGTVERCDFGDEQSSKFAGQLSDSM